MVFFIIWIKIIFSITWKNGSKVAWCRNAVAALSQPHDANESDSDDNIYQENGKIGNGYELFIPYIESGMDKSSDNTF